MEYKVEDTELTSIANAIRNACNLSDELEFPTDFIAKIASLNSAYIGKDEGQYLYRKSPTSIGSNYNSEEDTLVGGTVAWNQLVQNGNFADRSNWTATRGSLTASGNILTYTVTEVANNAVGNRVDSSDINLTANHIYLASAQIYPPRNTTFRFDLGQIGTVSANANMWNNIRVLRKPSSSATSPFRIAFNSSVEGYAVNDTVQIKNCICIDLTQMLGSTIADYVYSLEQTTSGSGVAWLKAHGFLTKDYYAYDAGSLKSVKTSEHRTTGKNLFHLPPEGTKNGITLTHNGDGSFTLNGTATRTTYIDAFAGDFDSTKFEGCVFNISGVTLSSTGIGTRISKADRVSLTPSNGSTINDNGSGLYFSIRIANGYAIPSGGVTIKSMLRYADTTDEFEPYIAHTYPLDSDLELRGLFKLNASNNLYYDGDVYPPSGEVERKYGYRAYQSGDESLADAITDGTNTVYKLTTPTTETADPFANPQIVSPLGTEEYVDTRDVPIPVGHETMYYYRREVV